jgi:tetratricopeptide (TPR) repeat protein
MYELGQITKAIEYGREALTIAREIGDRRSECTHLFNLGCAYNHNGKVEEARHYYSQAGEIADELGYGLIRAHSRMGLGDLLNFEGRWSEAIHFFQEVVSLADEMNFAQAQIEARLCLVHAFLGMDDLPRAEIAVKEAGRYTFRLGTPNVFALQGVIALRQSDVVGACEAFQEAIAQADELLQHSHFNWNALYGKALALAGLALCKDAGLVPAAAETYEQAQSVSSNLGILKGALYELDALLKADPKGLLKPVRAVVAGKTTLPRRHAGTRKGTVL